ncbi:MAG: hypothetical protein IJ890_00285 [Clostridia bacterium]|nr:hypothetical protein [Clostridia bacterium]
MKNCNLNELKKRVDLTIDYEDQDECGKCYIAFCAEAIKRVPYSKENLNFISNNRFELEFEEYKESKYCILDEEIEP